MTLPCWRKPFEQFEVKQRNALRHSLGNLLPLSKPKNSSLKNKCFSEKRDNPDSSIGYIYGCYSENEVAKVSEWNADAILERGLRLLDFMEERWQFKIGSRDDKIAALGLEFLGRKHK